MVAPGLLAPTINFIVFGHTLLKATCETLAIGGALDLVAQAAGAGPRLSAGSAAGR